MADISYDPTQGPASPEYLSQIQAPSPDPMAGGMSQMPDAGPSASYMSAITPAAQQVAGPPAPPTPTPADLPPGAFDVPAPPAAPATPSGPSQLPIVAVPGHAVASKEVPLAGPNQLAGLEKATHERMVSAEEAAKIRIGAAEDEYNQGRADAYAAGQRAYGAQQEMDRQRAEEEKARQAALSASNATVNSGRMWANMGTGGRVGSLIAIALSGIGQAMQHREGNPALDALNHAFEQDMKEQEFNIQHKRDAANTAFAQLVQQHGLSQAREIYAAAQREKAIAEAKAQAAQAKTPEIAANLQQTLGELQAQHDDYIAKATIGFQPGRVAGGGYMMQVGTDMSGKPVFAPVTSKQLTEQAMTQQNKAVEHGYTGQEKAAEHGYRMEEEGAKAEKQQKIKVDGLKISLPDGNTIQARNDTELNDLTKLIGASEDIRKLANEALQVREKLRSVDTVKHPLQAAAYLKDLKSIQGRMRFSQHANTGVMNAQEVSTVNDMTGDMLSLSPGTDAVIKRYAEHGLQSLRDRINTLPPENRMIKEAQGEDQPLDVRPLK